MDAKGLRPQGARGVVIAAPASGSGKTVVTLALLRALRDQGLRVASLKIGPDFIDPAYHAAAGGRPCFNLDLWGMRPATQSALLAEAARDSDLIVAEGVMGLFDGAADGTGSTAEAAAWAGWPVILVVDVRGQGASAAAIVRGFRDHRPGVTLGGVVFNRVGSEVHRAILEREMVGLGVPVIGYLPRDEAFVLDSRHLGLHQAGEKADIETWIGCAAAKLTQQIDTEFVSALAWPSQVARAGALDLPCLGRSVAVARDAAFSFLYPHLLNAWKQAGSAVRFFAPLADEEPPQDADAIYLPGGYPELHAARLAAAVRFKSALRHAAARKIAIYGECGGFMALGETLTDKSGTRHEMAGLLPLHSSFAAPKLHLGYRRLTLAADCALGPRGAAFRAHEFHYAAATPGSFGEPLFDAADSNGRQLPPMGCRAGSVAGSFAHLLDRA
jgi:cobyrinic acid a,c-diamide synthase